MENWKKETPETRKSQIISAAELVLLESGIERFTMDKVVAKAGIAKGTVYNYYKNRDEMLADLGMRSIALMHHYFREATSNKASAIQKVKGICFACHEFYKKYPRHFDLITYMERPQFDINISGMIRLSQDFQDFTYSIIQNGQQAGEIKPDLDPTTVNYIIWACCVGVVQFVESKKKLLKNYHEINTEKMIESFANMITEGLAC